MAMNYLGDFTTSNTVYVYFNTFDSNDPSASVTLTGLAVTDIEIYKDGSVTQRSSDAGYTLLDTDGIDFDGITGIHGFSIDLSNDTDSGFYAAGSEYTVVVSSVTVDAATINFVAASFSIERSGGALALLKGAGGLSDINTDVEAILNDTDLIDDGTSGLAKIATDVAAILVDTGTTLDGKIDTIDGIVDSILVDTGTTLQAELDGIQADTEDIQSRLPAALSSGNMKVDVLAISGDTTAADRLEEAATSVITGTVDAATPTPSTTAFGFTGTNGHTASTVDDFYNGKIVTFLTGNLAGQSTDVTDFTGTNNILTVTALTAAPDSASVFTLT